MARLLLAAIAALSFLPAHAATISLGNLSGWCTDGNQQVQTQGQNSSTRVQRSYVSAGTGCTVTVYYTGTTNTVSLYSNATGTSKANPFTAASSGQWTFWAPTGTYDIKFSNGGIASPFTIAGYSVTASPVYVTAFGAACDGSTNDATALASALSSGQSLAIPDGRICVTGTALTMNTNGQSLSCSAGGGLKASGIGQIITITATSNTIQGCTFDGNSAGSNGNILVYPNGPTALRFLNNAIKNTVAGQYPFRCDSCVDSLISGNQLITGMLGAGLTVFASSQNVQITGNTVIHTPGSAGSSAFDVQGGAGGIAVLQNIVLSGNSASETMGFCYEAGPFGGASASQITVTGNSCILVNTTGSASCSAGSNQRVCGGISVVASTDSLVTSNTISAGSQNVDIAGIEVGNARMTVSNNSIVMGGGTSGGAAGIQGYCAQCRITGNVINGWAQAAATNTAGIILFANANQTNADDTLIANNTLIFAGNPSAQSGMLLTCSQASGSQNRNIVVGNNVIGPGTGNTNYGINLFAGSASGCVNDGAIIASNNIYNINTALQLPSDTNLTIVGNRFTTVTTSFNCSSCTYVNTIIPASVSINKTTNPAVPLDVSGAANITGLVQASGGSYLTSGVSIGKSSAPSSGMDVATNSSFVNNICLSPTIAGYDSSVCQDTSNSGSPILTLTAGDGSLGYRGRIQLLAGGPAPGNGAFDFNSVDGVPIVLRDGNSNMLKCTPYYCLISNNSGLGSGFAPTCNSANEGVVMNVNDAMSNTWGANYVGGGSLHVLIRCDGSNFTIVAK